MKDTILIKSLVIDRCIKHYSAQEEEQSHPIIKIRSITAFFNFKFFSQKMLIFSFTFILVHQLIFKVVGVFK